MQKKRLFSSLSFVIATLSSLSLIAATSLPKQSLDVNEEDIAYYSDAESLVQDNTLMDNPDIIADSKEDTDLDLPFEEEDSNIEEQNKSAVIPPNLTPDVQKILYDSKMNYGTGAPIPKPAPDSTLTRNLIVLGTSLVLATVAMVVVSTNQGLDAPRPDLDAFRR